MTDAIAIDGNNNPSSITSKTPPRTTPEIKEVVCRQDEIRITTTTTTSSSSSLSKTILSHVQKQKQKQQQKYQERQQSQQDGGSSNCGGSGNGGDDKKIKKNTKIASRARHRLNSIFRDAQTIQNLLE